MTDTRDIIQEEYDDDDETEANKLICEDSNLDEVNKSIMKQPKISTTLDNFIISKTFTATGNSVTKHVINLNTEIGASTAGTLGYTVHVFGYGSGGLNGCNYKYTVGGYSGHDYSAQNHNSYGAGTIENGYDSAVNTEYDARGITYHPCKNLGAYIANGEIYAYVPGPQQYGVAISNNSNASFSIIITVSGTYTAWIWLTN